MCYENYGEYMRSLNNYQNMANPYLNMPTYQQPFNYANQNPNPNQLANSLYPKIYQEMIQKIDNTYANNDYRLTNENVTKITNCIYEEFKTNFPECKDSKQTDFIKDLIRIIVIKHLLSKNRNRSIYQQPIQGQMPFGYMGYQY